MRDETNSLNSSSLTSPAVRQGNVDMSDQEEQKPPLKISNLPAILWRRLWLIAIVLVVALASGIVYLRTATPLYRATTRLFVTSMGRNQALGDNPDLQPLQAARNYRATQVEILMSPLVLKRAADRPDIKAMKTFANADNIASALRAGLDVTVGNDDLMDISFSTPNWSEAAPIANAVGEAYIAFSDDYKKNSSAEALQILQREKSKLEDEVSQRLALIAKFKMESGGLALASKDKDGTTVLQGSVTLRQLNAFAEAMTKAQIDAVDAKANMESISALKSDPKRLRQYMDTRRAQGQAAASSPEELILRQELSRLYEARAEMAAKLGSGHPRYLSTLERIDAIEKSLLKYDLAFVDSQIAMAQDNYDAAQRRVQELAQYISANGEDAKKLNTQVAQYERLMGEMEQAKSRLDFLNARIRELDMSQDVRAMNVMLIESASEPLLPFSPNSGKVLKMCLAFGLILGLCLALAMEFMDDRMRSADQMSTVMGLPVLGVIPEIAEPTTEVGRTMEKDPTSAVAEAVRSFRTAVLFGMPDGQAKTIMITSPTPGDGKSTVAANLAESLAQSGRKTLLLDADMRKPRVEHIFGIRPEVGLSSIITGQGELDAAIQTGPLPNLDLIACGPIPPNPAELLNSDAFRSLLTTLSQRYDHIVVDTPPVLLVTDARVVAAVTDIAIIVLRADKCRARLASHAKDGILSVGGRLLGIVVNAAPQRRGRYGTAYGDSYGYGYGYGYRYGEGGHPDGRATTNAGVRS